MKLLNIIATTILLASTSIYSFPLQKRFTGQGTYYDPGLGACGGHHSASDMICALVRYLKHYDIGFPCDPR